MITILFPFRPISVNSAYYANRKFGMKGEAKDWCYKINWELDKVKDQLIAFKSEFAENSDGLQVHIVYHYKNFYSQNGTISSKTLDLTNTDKILVDLVIDAAHFGPAPYKSPNLNINDKNIIRLISEKVPALEDHITVCISKIPLKSQL